MCAQLWNGLPTIVKLASNIKLFKKLLRTLKLSCFSILYLYLSDSQFHRTNLIFNLNFKLFKLLLHHFIPVFKRL